MGSRSWAIATVFALVAASYWLESPSVQYLAPLVIATVASTVAGWALRGSQRPWALTCAAALVVLVLIAVPSQLELRSINRDWDGWERAAATRGLNALHEALDDAVRDVAETADRAILRSPDSSRANVFKALARLVPDGDERGVVIFVDDTAFAWAGQIHVPVDGAPTGLDVVNSSVYLALRVTATAGDRRATAVALINALPPGDRLAPTLAARIARRSGLAGFIFLAPSPGPVGENALRYSVNGIALFDVRPVASDQAAVNQRVTENARVFAGLALALALFAFIVAGWRSSRLVSVRMAVLSVVLVCVALAPLNEYSTRSRLFDAAVYYAHGGRQFTANAGALGISSAIVLLGLIAVIRRRRRRVSPMAGIATVLVVAGVGPFLLADLSRGVSIPPHGVDAALWLIWEVPIFLAAVSVLLAGAAGGSAIIGRARGFPPAVAPILAGAAAVVGPIVWSPAPHVQWPFWYTVLWIVAIGALTLSRQSRYMILSASIVAALGATTLVWGRTARGRVELAQRDLNGLNTEDRNTPELLRGFGRMLAADSAPNTRQALLEEYVRSLLAAADHPVALSAWPTNDRPLDSLRTAGFPMPDIRALVAEARVSPSFIVRRLPSDQAMVSVLAVRGVAGGVTAVVVAPNSQLFTPDSSVRLFGIDIGPGTAPPYRVELRQPMEASAIDTSSVEWQRRDDVLHGEWIVPTGTGAWRVHVEVDLRPVDALIERGALIALLDVAIVGVLWLVGVAADGGVGRWLAARRRSWGRSFRARLSLALMVFFVIPAAAFAIWSYRQIVNDAHQSRHLQVVETLHSVSVLNPAPTGWLTQQSNDVRAPLLLYDRGELRDGSDPLLAVFVPFGRFLDPEIELSLENQDEGDLSALEPLEGERVRVGYRPLARNGYEHAVLAAPATSYDLLVGGRRRDLGILVLFATALGGLAALWLSGIAARQLARPIATLRTAALSIAAGDRVPPFEGEPTVEFMPVFTAFRRMAADLHAGRSALEDAQRRTAAVLRNVASGVVAVGADGTITLANPRASSILEGVLPPGSAFGDAAPAALAEVVQRFLSSPAEEETFEVEMGSRQLRGRIARLARGGAVVTIDDVTELARAQRVLAWGEMARQVAHEIKNPLTPIRLGVQHLKRARADGRVDFDRVLDQNVSRILTEIDRLDEIARAFSRYGSAPHDRRPAEPVDVAAVVRDVVALEQMGVGDGVSWEIRGVDSPVVGMAGSDELKEVLLNLLDNARLAQARTVTVDVAHVDGDGERASVRVTVHDDGHGIPADVMPRIFEPHFSTRTSGSGLGLAISRQLIDGWGGEIGVDSAAGEGTTVTLTLRALAL